MNIVKPCTKCNQTQPIENYPKDRTISSGFKAKCKKCYSDSDKARYLMKQDIVKDQARTWYSLNKEKAAASKRTRLKNDINAHLADVLRSRLNKAIKRNSKTGSAINLLGCSVDEFKSYLESKFQPGMSWDNYGVNGWHIDHIRPLNSFDLNNEEELKIACNFNNMQPLWAINNWSKGAKWL